MKKARTITWILLGALGASILLNQAVIGQNSTVPTSPKIGVVDITILLATSKRSMDLTQEFQKRRQELNVEAKKKSQEIADAKAMLEAMTPGEDYEKQLRKIREMEYDAKSWRSLEQEQIERDYYRLTREMYVDILQAVENVAKKQSIDLVLYNRKTPPTGRDVNELLNNIERQKVLYNDDKLEITTSVMEELNKLNEAAGK